MSARDWQDDKRRVRSFPADSLFKTSKPVWARRMKDAGVEIMPGFLSDSPEVIDFLDKTIDTLSAIYDGKDVLDDGTVGRSGVHEPFDRYKTVSGYSMKPMSFTTVDNKSIRTEKGLPNEWRRPRDKELFEQLCHLFFREIKFKNIKTNRISTSGFPEFETAYEKKIEWIDEILQSNNIDAVMKKVRLHDLRGLLVDHNLVIASAVNKRRQDDLQSKIRLVVDYEYAVTSGREGRRFAANKEVILRDGSVVDGFSAQRIRPVKGSPIRLTALLQPFAAGVRASIADRFAFNFKHTTDEDSAEKLNRYGHLCSTDYTEFDSTYPGFMRESMLKVMEFYFDPAIIELARLSFASPYFQPAVYALPANATEEQAAALEKSDPGRWVGNPLDINDFIFNSGIVSGNPFVDIEGKLGGTFDSMVKFDYILGDMDKRLEAWLSGRDPLIANRNQGDDNQALSSDLELIKRFSEVTLAKDEGKKDDNGVAPYKYSYFAADLEKGHVFTGKITTWYNDRGDRGDKLIVIPRVGGFLRWFTHERGINAITREFWPIGFFERQSIYGLNPAWGDVWREASQQWTKSTGTSLETLAAKAYNASTMPKVNVKTLADLEVLLDPQKLSWFFTDDDAVSPNVRAIFEGSPNVNQVEQYVAKYYRGHIY